MPLYFVSVTDELIGSQRGAKVGYGQSSPELEAWRSANADNIIPLSLPVAEAASALTAGVIDFYVTPSLDVARSIAGAMSTAFIYDANQTLHYADDVPDTPDPNPPPPSSPNDPPPTDVKLILRSDLNIDSPSQLSGAAIGFVSGSPAQAGLFAYFESIGVQFQPVAFASLSEATAAYRDGRTDVLAVSNSTEARTVVRDLGGLSEHVLLDLPGGEAVPGYVLEVALLYEAGLAREADVEGLNFWIDRHEDGMDLNTMAGSFLDSEEFTLRFGNDDDMTPGQFVNVMYMNVLDRPGEEAGLQYWESQLSAGATRESILRNFAASPENAQASTVGLLFEALPGYWTFG